MSAVPPKRLQVLSEVCASWIWTVRQGYGLFSGDSVRMVRTERGRGMEPANKRKLFDPPAQPSSVEVSACCVYTRRRWHLAAPPDPVGRAVYVCVQGPTKLPDQLASDEPHRVWLAFLVDRYRLVQTRSCEELAMIMQVCAVRALLYPARVA